MTLGIREHVRVSVTDCPSKLAEDEICRSFFTPLREGRRPEVQECCRLQGVEHLIGVGEARGLSIMPPGIDVRDFCSR